MKLKVMTKKETLVLSFFATNKKGTQSWVPLCVT